MNWTGLKRFSCIILTFALTTARILAEVDSTSSSTNTTFSLEDNFRKGQHQFSLGAGPLFSPFHAVNGRPTINYAQVYVQYGYMVTGLMMDGSPLRGNFELVPEAFGSAIWESTGNYIAGGTLWFRYNFVPRQWKVTPYAQVGGGFTVMDIDHRYDGHNFNFNVDASLGLRYFIKPRLSLDAEFRYQHISNANTGSRNLGINAVGPMLGISWFF